VRVYWAGVAGQGAPRRAPAAAERTPRGRAAVALSSTGKGEGYAWQGTRQQDAVLPAPPAAAAAAGARAGA